MKRTIRIALLFGMLAVMLSGCGKEFSPDTDTVYVQKKGTIKGANVAAFDKEYYDESELEQFITDTVDTYVTQSGEGTVSVSEFAVEEGIAHVYLDYASAEDYAEFNGVDFYVGTVLDARADGYEILDDFTPVTDRDTTWDAQDNKIVIVGQETQVRVDGTILFASPNVNVTEKNIADVTFDLLDEEATPGYIVYK